MIEINKLESDNELNPISDFKYIYDLAKCSKCQMFTVLRGTNKLYGTNDECSFIYEISIPFLVNTDIEFRFDNNEKNIAISYNNFFIPKKFNWAIVPDYYWDLYISGDIYESEDQSILYNRITNQPIEVIHMYKFNKISDYPRMNFNNQLNSFLYRCNTLSYNVNTFQDIHQDSIIRKIFDNKVSMGRVLCQFSNDNINIAFYLYKSLFSLAKADSLNLEIRFDKFDNRLFMASFIPKKKKNPLMFNTYSVPFQGKIHCMYINLI